MKTRLAEEDVRLGIIYLILFFAISYRDIAVSFLFPLDFYLFRFLSDFLLWCPVGIMSVYLMIYLGKMYPGVFFSNRERLKRKRRFFSKKEDLVESISQTIALSLTGLLFVIYADKLIDLPDWFILHLPNEGNSRFLFVMGLIFTYFILQNRIEISINRFKNKQH